MSVSSVSLFFALLCLACGAATVATWVLCLVGRRTGESSNAGALLEELRSTALWLAWLVATVTMLGSLYYSLVAHYEPCELCWYLRICIYPLSAVLLVAAIRREDRVFLFVLPQLVVGIGLAVYQTQLQAFPDQRSFCELANPCTVRYVWEFGFVSLPFMALVSCCFMTTMVLLARGGGPVRESRDR